MLRLLKQCSERCIRDPSVSCGCGQQGSCPVVCAESLEEGNWRQHPAEFCFEISAFLPSQVDDWQPEVLSFNSQLSSDCFLSLLFLQSFVSILTIQSDLKRNGVIRKKSSVFKCRCW